MSRHRFYPVIHCLSYWNNGGAKHAIDNTRVALDNGADGVMLIGHELGHQDLCNTHNAVRGQFPTAWIGVNFLDIPANSANFNALERALNCIEANAIWLNGLAYQELTSLECEVFAGVAFKYLNPNPSDHQLAKEVSLAIDFANTITTSGDKTGSTPSIDKLKRIADLVSEQNPIAVASGVDATNVLEMKQHVQTFLVASSISVRYGQTEHLAPKKVEWLGHLIHFG